MNNTDLISRSALLGGYDVRKVTEYDESGCGLEYKAVSVEAIEAAPAVDAEPVRHGKNLNASYKSLFKCSECDWECWDTLCGDTDTYNYCPNCGAKMIDGDVNGNGL